MTTAPTNCGPTALELPKPERTSSMTRATGNRPERRVLHVPYKVTIFPFPAGLPFATQIASFRSRIKSSTLEIVSRCHLPSDSAAILRHTCVPCKRYEVPADSAARSDATPSSTFCPQLLVCSNSVSENRTPLQKLVVFPRYIIQEKKFEWSLEWPLPR